MTAARVTLVVIAWAAACLGCLVCVAGLAPMSLLSLLITVSDRFATWYFRATDWWIYHTSDRAIEWAARVTAGVR